MKTSKLLVLISAGGLAWSAAAEENSPLVHRWQTRFDIGGSFPSDATLTEIGGPVTGGGELKLSAGIQFDAAVGFRFTPWLTLEAEFGFMANAVDSVRIGMSNGGMARASTSALTRSASSLFASWSPAVFSTVAD
jgi:hypothetical protein